MHLPPFEKKRKKKKEKKKQTHPTGTFPGFILGSSKGTPVAPIPSTGFPLSKLRGVQVFSLIRPRLVLEHLLKDASGDAGNSSKAHSASSF